MAISLRTVLVACAWILISLDEHLLVSSSTQVNFILVGATGNLAQKYLWQSLYDLSKTTSDIEYEFYGGARANYSSGSSALQRILSDDVKYENEDEKHTFINRIKYTQLKTCEDYERLCESIGESFNRGNANEQYCSAGKSCENDVHDDFNKWLQVEQIFYLSVPPYTYGELGECISRVCHSKSRRTKIVLEKPYGSDAKTVDALIDVLRPLFDEEQVYLVDHYLGKTVVRNILPFRFDNREWLEPLLNRDHVERIEVVIKEKESVKGRLNYYDSYGVFLDIIQNHAVELLTLVAMDLTSSDLANTTSSDLVKLKMQFLDSVTPITSHDLVYAQYRDYVREGRSEFKVSSFNSVTPTFGAVLLRSSSHRWSGVPMVLISGKLLDSKSSYVRIQFKDNQFFPSTHKTIKQKELVFAVSSNFKPEISEPCIAISPELLNSDVQHENDWVPQGDFYLKPFDQPDRAYFRVIDDVVNARRENFVSLKQLKSSWNIWTLAVPHLKALTEISHYDEADLDALAFSLSPAGLLFHSQSKKPSPSQLKHEQGGRVTVGSEVEIVQKVVEIISETAKDTLRQWQTFHMAFPGGNTPKLLFQALTGLVSFPWELTHFWFVDERCTERHKSDSNFRNAYVNLLKHVRIPIDNIHPMPVHLSRGLCSVEDKGVEFYSSQLDTWTNDNQLDLVVLGVGSDGHVASLFPNTKLDQELDGAVILTEAPSGGSTAKRRMTLTWSAIKAAKKVLVLVTGREKRTVVRELFEGNLPVNKFPVKNLLDDQNVHFLIDEESYQKPD